MKNLKCLALSIAVLFSLSCCTSTTKTAAEGGSLHADSPTQAAQDSAKDSAETQGEDPKLVYELVESMYAGIAVMKQGEEKAAFPAVKSLAKKLAAKHTKLTEELKTLATKKNWPLPAGESVDDKDKREDLAKKNGADYDKTWLEALADRHQTNIGKIKDAKPTDPDLKMAAEKGLAKIEELLADIEAVQKQVK